MYLDERDAEDDWLYFTSAGLRVDLLPDTHEITAGYKVRIYEFLGSSALDRIEHVADLKCVAAFTNLRIEAGNTFEKLNDPLNFWYTKNIDRLVDTASASAIFKAGMFRLGAEYEFKWYDFGGAFNDIDNMGHTAAAQVKVEISPKLEIIADYAYSLVDYRRNAFSDFQTHTVFAGLGGLVTAKIRGMIKAGYIYQVVGGASGDPSYKGFTGLVTVAWAPTESFKLDLSYVRAIEISQFRSYQVVDRGELKAEQRFGPKVGISAYGSVEFTDPADRPGAPAYQSEWFLRLSMGLRIEYNVQEWFAAGAWFEYLRRITDIDGEEYQAVRAGVHLTFYL